MRTRLSFYTSIKVYLYDEAICACFESCCVAWQMICPCVARIQDSDSPVTLDLLRKRAEHNSGEISSLEEVSLHQQDIER
jgi:hypothetical protein